MLRTILVFAILIPGVAAAFSDRFSAFLMYVWIALFRPQDWVWFDITSLRPSLVFFMLLVIPAFFHGIFPNLTHPISIAALLFLLASAVAQINAVVPSIGWNWLNFLFILILVALLGVTLIRDRKRFVLALAVLSGSLGFHAAKAGLASVFGGGVRFFDGFAGAFADNNGYAVGMVMITPFLLASAQNLQHRAVKAAFYCAVPLTALAVVSTFSRGGFLALVAMSLAYLVLQRRRLLGLAVAAVLSVPLYMFMSSQAGYIDRIDTIETYDETNEDSATSRLHFWSVALTMATDNPLGVGLFNYEQAYDKYDDLEGRFGFKRSVHSSHFQVLTEAGFLGLAAYVTLFVCAFRCAWRIRRRSKNARLDPADQRLYLTAANALMASMTGFLVGGAFISMALNDVTWLTFGMVAALDRISRDACAEAQGAIIADHVGLVPAWSGALARP